MSCEPNTTLRDFSVFNRTISGQLPCMVDTKLSLFKLYQWYLKVKLPVKDTLKAVTELKQTVWL